MGPKKGGKKVIKDQREKRKIGVLKDCFCREGALGGEQGKGDMEVLLRDSKKTLDQGKGENKWTKTQNSATRARKRRNRKGKGERQGGKRKKAVVPGGVPLDPEQKRKK